MHENAARGIARAHPVRGLMRRPGAAAEAPPVRSEPQRAAEQRGEERDGRDPGDEHGAEVEEDPAVENVP